MPMPRFERRALAAMIVLALTVDSTQAAIAQTGATNAPAENDAFYCEERKLGYWFYCTKPKPAPKTEAAAPAPVPDAVTRMDAITAELRELKARAILEPTPANVTAYIRFQREQLDRASLFSDVWQRAIWQDPELDYTLQRPVSTLAKRQWQDSRASERNGVMMAMSPRSPTSSWVAATMRSPNSLKSTRLTSPPMRAIFLAPRILRAFTPARCLGVATLPSEIH